MLHSFRTQGTDGLGYTLARIVIVLTFFAQKSDFAFGLWTLRTSRNQKYIAKRGFGYSLELSLNQNLVFFAILLVVGAVLGLNRSLNFGIPDCV